MTYKEDFVINNICLAFVLHKNVIIFASKNQLYSVEN